MEIKATANPTIYSATIQNGYGDLVWFDSGTDVLSLVDKTYRIICDQARIEKTEEGKNEFYRSMMDSIERYCHLNPNLVVKVGDCGARLFAR
jgi:hypothetical protein